MRIISGSARGRKLAEFSGTQVRPTSDRAREALFSLLFSRLGNFSGMTVLDLFAGSGAMSLEALSRNATSAVLLDSSPAAIKLIEENVRRCKFEAQVTVLRQDACKGLAGVVHQAPYDLIFMDPPYGKNLIPRVLNEIDCLNLLSVGGIICAESETGFSPAETGRLECFDTRRYGSSAIHLFRTREKIEDQS